MKLLTAFVAIALLQAPAVFAKANCLHSHSWQCQGQPSQSSQGSQTGTGIATGGQTPDPAQTNTHLGSTSTSTVPMMTLQPATEITPMVALQPATIITPMVALQPATLIVKPPQPVTAIPPQPQMVAPGKVPVLAPSQVPPQPQMVAPGKVPVLAPSQVPPQQVYLVPPKVITGYAAVPSRPIITAPTLVPPKKPPVQVYAQPPKTFSGQGQVPVPQITKVPSKLIGQAQSPPLKVYPNPQPIVVGNARVPPPQANPNPAQATNAQGQLQTQQSGGVNPALALYQPSHLLTNNRAGQYGVGGQLSKSDYGKEVVEPGIMNSRVALYRSHDVEELAFKDTIPMDATGFHLNFVGIREPVFTIPAQSMPEAESSSGVQSDASVKGKPFVFFFDYASTAIHPDQVGLYDDIVTEYEATGKRLILISETDGFGSFEYNTALASHRGAMIVAALQERGVKAEDVETRLLVRFGRSDPSTEDSHRVSSTDRIAWVHFE